MRANQASRCKTHKVNRSEAAKQQSSTEVHASQELHSHAIKVSWVNKNVKQFVILQ
jgi:hypothetical protein